MSTLYSWHKVHGPFEHRLLIVKTFRYFRSLILSQLLLILHTYWRPKRSGATTRTLKSMSGRHMCSPYHTALHFPVYRISSNGSKVRNSTNRRNYLPIPMAQRRSVSSYLNAGIAGSTPDSTWREKTSWSRSVGNTVTVLFTLTRTETEKINYFNLFFKIRQLQW